MDAHPLHSPPARSRRARTSRGGRVWRYAPKVRVARSGAHVGARSVCVWLAGVDAEMNEGLVRVISGGQIGADQAALRAARHLGLETGGTAPKGYRTSVGSQRELLASYGLAEGAGTGTASYVARSKKNVDDAHATLAFRTHSSAG